MSINIGPPEVEELKPKIAVIGVGGAGGNAIANMIAAQVEGVDFIVSNTDAQSLNSSTAERRIQLGPDITQGLGAGSRPEVGRAAAEETIDLVEQALEGTHMCFIAAGMGGGTGTGAAPVIAKAARDRGILTVGVVTKPFTFEGTRRMKAAEAGIEELQKNVDTLIVIPNQNLFLVANPNTTFKEAFLLADEVLQQGVRGITDLMVMPGLINLDFADVRSVMHEMGQAMMGTGEAEGDGRALEAAEKAIANPLLDGVSMQGAKGVIVSITGGEDMRLMEVDEAANHIRELVDPDANIIWGSAFNPNLDGRIRVSVVATGIDNDGVRSSSSPSTSFAMGSPAAKTEDTSAPSSFASSIASDDDVEEAAQEAEIASAPVPDQEPEPEVETAAEPEASPAPVATYGDDDDLSVTPSFASLTPGIASKSAAPEEDELILGDDAIQPADEDAAPAARQAPPAPRVATSGGTLFERMSNLTRGGSKGDDADDGEDDKSRDPLDIPRFLNRQNNQ
ncbi:cell division protein FtsZ [Sphingorhabdus sp. 109]|jgi:cell division protein FtsZ|uniref:cell division protein FtsZ n=1 Tax=Sphingorhabdus sp. 109 TaxID=2653173 RepID=UPI0012EFB15D|nr:cell division protein FtsZ [Sphingorhabdus sp. 109]VWX58734.1 Cell division protein FtsZ [Sphingorhabdus sp. 109]